MLKEREEKLFEEKKEVCLLKPSMYFWLPF